MRGRLAVEPFVPRHWYHDFCTSTNLFQRGIFSRIAASASPKLAADYPALNMYLGRGNLALLVRAKDGRRIVCTSVCPTFLSPNDLLILCVQLAPKAVPKFASFRPKPDQLSKNPSSDGARDPEHRGAGSTVSERYHDSHDYHSTGTDVRRHKSKSRRQPLSQDRQGQDKISHITVIPWDDEPDIFIVDKVGDTANLEYGSLHRYAIPSYFRSGSGRILGLSNDQKIDRQASNEKSVIVSDSYRDQHVKRDKAVFARIGRDRETRVKPVFSAAKCSIDVDADYLSLGHQRLNKRQRLEAEAVASLGESTEDESSHYRSIEGKAKATIVPEDSDLEFNDTVSDSKREVSPMDDVNLRKLALSRKVDSEPSNGDAWLKLIDYQETVLSYQSGNGRSSAADRASMADIKLCMYEKALTLVETPHYTERLLLGIMESGTKIWDLRKVSSKWKTLLQQHVGYMGLWTKYLDFQQTNFAAFRFDEVRVGFVTCLGIIREAIIKAGTNQAQRDTLITIQIYVLLRLTLCTREAGFPEQSTAIWQAVLEFNCCRSLALTVESQVSVPFERLLAGFEDFWESEVSRMGEENSVGWRNYNAHDGRLPHPKADDSMPNGIGRPIIADWSEYEAAHFSQSRKPARTIDDTVEDDPYRVVLFSDVKDFIVDVPSSSHQLLLYAFLAFCHLPTPENPAEDARAWWRDPFIRNDGQCGWERLLHSLSNLSEGIKLQLQPEKDNSTSASLTQALGLPTQFYLPSTASLFAKRGSWFSAFDEWTAQCAKNNGPVDADWTRQVLRMLVDNGIGGDNVAEYLLALECNVMPSAAKKTAKALLKKDPSSLRLYNAYALIECRLGNLGIAESVFTTAINMSRSLDEISQKNVILLWRTWIWELLDSKNADSALERLLTLPDEVITVDSRSIVANPATNLRTQKVSVHMARLISTNDLPGTGRWSRSGLITH